jgi:uncharacterized protein
MSAAALVVLMRWPRPGEGKTRLAARLGIEYAHRLHRAFVADTLAWPAPHRRVLAVAPDDAALAAAARAAPDAVVTAQAAGDLGCRIAAALGAAMRGGTDRAVLVGTDSPSLPSRLLWQCLDVAGDVGAAMVPAEDGGFIALAVHRGAARHGGLRWLRSGIAWSTSRTAEQTVAAARRARVAVGITAPWYDVDELEDLPRLHADLVAAPLQAPRTLRCLGELGDDWMGAAPVPAAELAS